MADCTECKYRQWLASAYDIHIDEKDCDKANTYYCEKMRRKDVVLIIDAGCTDKTIYSKGYADGKRDAVKHGWWSTLTKDGYHLGVNCSECKTTWDVPSKFCPYCGALMDQEDGE